MNGTHRSPEVPGPPALSLEIDGLCYSLQALPTNGQKAFITVARSSGGTPQRLVRHVELQLDSARKVLSQVMADSFAISPDTAMSHLTVVLDAAERMSFGGDAASVELSPERRAAAENVLAQSSLLDAAANVMEQRGYVGEDTNKRIVYLVATSRLLPKPASVILKASSAAGKSELLERVAELLPESAVEFLSRITAKGLYYMSDLRHRVVVVDEQAGAAEADYALRTLQTKGLLRLATPAHGEPRTVHGPIALLSGTTSPNLNPENLSRCLVLALDESEAQTRRVQAAQRRAWTGKTATTVDLVPWQDAQSLLEPLEVVIPYAEQLAFPSRSPFDRRENGKLLTLVASHTLLHQRQRDRDRAGRVVATIADYAAIYGLMGPLVETVSSDLSPRAAKLRDALSGGVSGTTFTRVDAERLTGQSYMTISRALDELVAHELVVEVGRGSTKTYQLVTSHEIGRGSGLTHPSELETVGPKTHQPVTTDVVSPSELRSQHSVGA